MIMIRSFGRGIKVNDRIGYRTIAYTAAVVRFPRGASSRVTDHRAVIQGAVVRSPAAKPGGYIVSQQTIIQDAVVMRTSAFVIRASGIRIGGQCTVR